MSNLPKIVTIVALGFVGAVSAGYYALTGQKGSDGTIVIATGGLPHYQELGAAYQKALEPFGVQVVMQGGWRAARRRNGRARSWASCALSGASSMSRSGFSFGQTATR